MRRIPRDKKREGGRNLRDAEKRAELAQQLSLYALFRSTGGSSAFYARRYAEV